MLLYRFLSVLRSRITNEHPAPLLANLLAVNFSQSLSERLIASQW